MQQWAIHSMWNTIKFLIYDRCHRKSMELYFHKQDSKESVSYLNDAK